MASKLKCWVIWFKGDDSEEAGVCKTGPNGTHISAYDDPQTAYDTIENCCVDPSEFEVREYELVPLEKT
jgi:hypothetical protein